MSVVWDPVAYPYNSRAAADPMLLATDLAD